MTINENDDVREYNNYLTTNVKQYVNPISNQHKFHNT